MYVRDTHACITVSKNVCFLGQLEQIIIYFSVITNLNLLANLYVLFFFRAIHWCALTLRDSDKKKLSDFAITQFNNSGGGGVKNWTSQLLSSNVPETL